MRDTFSVKGRTLIETNLVNKLSPLLIKANPNKDSVNSFRHMSSIGNYRGGFGMINDSAAGAAEDERFEFDSSYASEVVGGPGLRKTDGILLSIEEKFRFVHHLIKLMHIKISSERKHFTNMRRFALNNN